MRHSYLWHPSHLLFVSQNFCCTRYHFFATDKISYVYQFFPSTIGLQAIYKFNFCLETAWSTHGCLFFLIPPAAR